MNNNKNIKSHKVANKNNNVEHKDPYRDLNIYVPYYNMATVMEGFKLSCIASPIPTMINLIDSAYDITLSIGWAPTFYDNNSDWCAINQFLIILLHHDKEVQTWTNKGEENNPYIHNYTEMQDVINDIVKNDIEEARNSGEDLDNDYMRLWLTGKALNIPGLSVSDVVKKWEIVFNGKKN